MSGFTDIASKKLTFVSFEMQYNESEDGDSEVLPMLIISPEERAATNLGARQGDHSTALSLSMERVINAINNGFPTEDTNFKGISELTAVLYNVVRQDEFFLKKFFPDAKDVNSYDKENIFILGQYGNKNIFTTSIDKFIADIEAEFKKTNTRIDLLKQASSGRTDESVLLLRNFAREIKLEYCASLATKAARHVIEYQNKSPWAAFEKKPVLNEKEESFNKSESRRVVDALEALRAFKDSEDSHSQDRIVSHIVNLLYYPKVDDAYDAATMHEYKIVADRRKGVKTGHRGPIPRINKRTNDKDIFCYVVTRHLATIFSTFMELNLSSNKMSIIDKAIDLIMTTDNKGATLKWYDMANAEIKQKIKNALAEWEQAREIKIEALDISASSVNTDAFGDLGEDLYDDSKRLKTDDTDIIKMLRTQIELLSIDSQKELQNWLNDKISSATASGANILSSSTTSVGSRISETIASAASNFKTTAHQYSSININYGPSTFLWASKRMVYAIGSSGKILNGLAKDGLKNGLSRLARPICSIDGTMRMR